jgi:hypothetical protein
MTKSDAGSSTDRRTVIEAVLGLVGKIKADLARLSPSLRYPTEQEAELLRIWIQEALRVLGDDDLSPRVRDAVTALDKSVLKSTWIARLETLQRLLETRLAILGGPSAIERPQPEPASQIEGSPAASTQAADTSTRDEDALVARATERLFGSRAFMIMGAFLVAAAALAGVGSLVIGGTTATITKTLLDTGNAAKENITAITKEAKSDADTRVKLLETTQKAIADSQTAIERSAQTAQANIMSELARVTGELGKLKDKAVEEVIQKIQADLGRDAKPLHDRIEQAAAAFAGEIEALSAQQLAPLSARIRTLSGALSADEQKQKDLAPSLASLASLADKIEQITKDVAQASGYATAAANAANEADNAKEHADAAKGYRDAVFKRLGDLDSETGKQLQIFGDTKGKLDVLVQRVASLNPTVCDQPDLGSGPWAAQAQLNCLKQRIAVIEAQMKAPATAPASPPPEPSLSRAQWLAIQHELANKGLYKGVLDGDPGSVHPESSKTRQAIRDWKRASKGEQQPDGQLTEDQIADLIRGWQASRGEPADGQLTQAQTAQLLRELSRHRYIHPPGSRDNAG